MSNHSLINANRNTHAKIALLALAVSVVFIAAVAGVGGGKLNLVDARAHGPVVKATTLINVAGSGSLVR